MLFVNRSVMFAVVPGAVRATPPVIPPVFVGAGYEKVAPDMDWFVVNTRFEVAWKDASTQSVWAKPVVTMGTGLTVITTGMDVPIHPLIIGYTV